VIEAAEQWESFAASVGVRGAGRVAQNIFLAEGKAVVSGA